METHDDELNTTIRPTDDQVWEIIHASTNWLHVQQPHIDVLEHLEDYLSLLYHPDERNHALWLLVEATTMVRRGNIRSLATIPSYD